MSEIGIITYPGMLDFPASSMVKDPPANAGDPRERDVGEKNLLSLCASLAIIKVSTSQGCFED